MTNLGARFIEPVKKTGQINPAPTIVQKTDMGKLASFARNLKKLTKGGEERI